MFLKTTSTIFYFTELGNEVEYNVSRQMTRGKGEMRPAIHVLLRFSWELFPHRLFCIRFSHAAKLTAVMSIANSRGFKQSASGRKAAQKCRPSHLGEPDRIEDCGPPVPRGPAKTVS